MQRGFQSLWWFLNTFTVCWLQIALIGYAHSPISPWAIALPLPINMPQQPILAGMAFYLIFSFCNYWLHRAKHRLSFLWRHVHTLHHGPRHMGTQLAFFRHPTEVVINTLSILIISRLLLDISLEALAVTLTIESCLEIFHHANIKLPRRLGFIRYVVQTPDMHLVHHERGVHRHNYSPLSLWDGLFQTMCIPDQKQWRRPLGLDRSLVKIMTYRM